MNSENLNTVFSILNLTTLIVTSIIVFFYTKATYSLLNAAKEQNELVMLPLLTLRYVDGPKYPKMVIKNIGKGAALNVKVKNIEMYFKETREKYTLKLALDKSNILEPGEKREVSEEVILNGHRLRSNSLMPYFDPRFAESNRNLQITFENALGIKYELTLRTGQTGVSVVSPPRKIAQ